ncbi:MAG: hypothetical protein Kow0042_01720 [Calditrichia bacterium]
MSFVPDWAPNIHPMIIHFPIVLFLFALLFDILNIFFKEKRWLHHGALMLYGFGVLAALAAFFSGRQAADSLTLPDSVLSSVSEHANWALRTVWFFGIFVLLRFAALWKQFDRKKWVLAVLVVLAVVGNYLVYETAEHGAQLVYRFGVGTKQSVQVSEPETGSHQEESAMHEHGEGEEHKHRETPGVVQGGATAWKWEIDENALTVLKNELQWENGNPGMLNPVFEQDAKFGTVLALRPAGAAATFTFGKTPGNVSVTAVLNADDFQGEFSLVHHYRDSLNFDFLNFSNQGIKLGRVVAGKQKIMDSKPLKPSGWNTLQVVGTKGHFRGVVNGRLVNHGHGKDLPDGDVGFSIKGSGKILLKSFEFKALE